MSRNALGMPFRLKQLVRITLKLQRKYEMNFVDISMDQVPLNGKIEWFEFSVAI